MKKETTTIYKTGDTVAVLRPQIDWELIPKDVPRKGIIIHTIALSSYMRYSLGTQYGQQYPIAYENSDLASTRMILTEKIFKRKFLR